MIIAIGGLPLAGKTTLGRLLSAKTGIHYVDIDDGPAHCALPMADDPYSTPEKTAVENARMDILYEVLHATALAHISVGHSLIISATYRTADRRGQLLETIEHGNDFEFLLCRMDDTTEEVARRVDLRTASKEIGGCRSVEQYFKLRPLWTKPDFPHRVIDTTQGPHVALEQALRVLELK